MTVYVLLFLSVSINIVFGWYGYRHMKNFVDLIEEIRNFREKSVEFRNHLKVVYELETFYGDEILKNLLRHSIQFGKDINNFREVTSIIFEDEEDDDEEELESDEEELEDDEQGQNRTTQTGNVYFN